MTYAAKTDIPLMRSIADLERLVRSAGFGNFVQGIADDRIVAAFSSPEGRQVRFVVPVREPGPELVEHMRKVAALAKGRRPTTPIEAWEQHRRQLGRALFLTVKAKIECIEAGIETFEDAFMSQLALPDGRTVGSMVKAEMRQLYASGATPPRLLPAPEEA
jgi:hypothetical protein